MRDGALVSNSEKLFVIEAVLENLRIDNRQQNEHRQETIYFGKEWGSCLVTLGETRVLAQVSCDIQQPKASKPTEGLLYVHVEMSPMTSLNFDSSRQSEMSVQVNRLLEKCFKDSKCVDLESLCIVADEKVWNIRVDLNVMNYDGNLAGCCSIAALTALAHFKRPDVTSTGDQVIIHSFSEKEPISMTLHHYPVIVSYALFNSGNHILIDPTALEERVADSLMLLSVNSYHEICGMHLEGAPLPSSDVVLKCSKNAVHIAEHLVKQIKRALSDDDSRRSQKDFKGLTESLNVDHILAKVQENLKIRLKREKDWRDEMGPLPKSVFESDARIIPAGMETDEDNSELSGGDSDASVKMENDSDEDIRNSKYSVKSVAQKTAELQVKPETLLAEDSDSDESDSAVVLVEDPKKTEEIQLSDDSEEENTITLESSYK